MFEYCNYDRNLNVPALEIINNKATLLKNNFVGLGDPFSAALTGLNVPVSEAIRTKVGIPSLRLLYNV